MDMLKDKFGYNKKENDSEENSSCGSNFNNHEI